MADFSPGPPVQRNPSGFASGVITVGAAAVAGPSVALAVGVSVVLTAAPTNTASVFIGPSGVTTATGFELTPGSGITICVVNLDRLFFITTAAEQSVRYAVETL